MNLRDFGLGLLSLLLMAAPSVSQDETPEALRAAAQAAFDKKQWTTPAGDNAFEICQRLLKAVPGDPTALEIKRKIVAQYITLADEKLEEGNAGLARRFLKRALKVEPDHQEVQLRLERANRSLREAKQRAKDSVIAAFNRAETQASYAAWAEFLAKHPDSEFDSYARSQLLALGRGSIRITSEPAELEGEVFFNGERAGRTPLLIEQVEAGSHNIRVEVPGHETFEGSVEVEPGQEARSVAKFQKPIGPLFETSARHRHFGGGCYGTLTLHDDRLEYQAQNRKHSLILLWREIAGLDLTNPHRIGLTSLRTRKQYNFELQDQAMDARIIKVVSELARRH